MNHLYKAPYLFTLLLTFSAAHATPALPRNSDYFIDQKIPLTKKLDGIEASLEIWHDRRLTNADIRLMKQHDPDNNPLSSTKFRKVPVKPAIVALSNSDNPNNTHLLLLEKPYAAVIDKLNTELNKRMFLITQDFGIEFGSYNGPITRLLEVNSGSPKWMEAFDKNSNKYVQLSLMRSLKSAWNFDAKTNDILQVQCRPDDSPEGFVTYFSRYRHDGRQWTVTTKTESIYWEAEDGDRELGVSLPDLKRFPQ